MEGGEKRQGLRVAGYSLGSSEPGNIYLVQEDTEKHFSPIRGGPGAQRGFYSVCISGHYFLIQAICCRQLNPSYRPTSSHQVDQKELEMSRTPQRTGYSMPCVGVIPSSREKWGTAGPLKADLQLGDGFLPA